MWNKVWSKIQWHQKLQRRQMRKQQVNIHFNVREILLAIISPHLGYNM